MTIEHRLERIRLEIQRFRKDRPHGALPRDIRTRASEYVFERIAEGAQRSDLAREIGVTHATINAWGAGAATRTAKSGGEKVALGLPEMLVPVLLNRGADANPSEGRVELDFPNGVKMRWTGVTPSVLREVVSTLRGA